MVKISLEAARVNAGYSQKEAAEKLVKLGYTNIVEFGGINDWNGETVS